MTRNRTRCPARSETGPALRTFAPQRVHRAPCRTSSEPVFMVLAEHVCSILLEFRKMKTARDEALERRTSDVAGGPARLERPDSGVSGGQRWHVSVLLFSCNGEQDSVMARPCAAGWRDNVQLMNQRRGSRVQHPRWIGCSHVKERREIGRDEGRRTKTRTLACQDSLTGPHFPIEFNPLVRKDRPRHAGVDRNVP